MYKYRRISERNWVMILVECYTLRRMARMARGGGELGELGFLRESQPVHPHRMGL